MATVSPNPSNFTRATYTSRYTFPDVNNPMVIKNGQKITLTLDGNKYPGTDSSPKTNSDLSYFMEVTLNVTSGTLTRSNFTLPAGAQWLGTTGLTFRLPASLGAVGWPPMTIPGRPPAFSDADNPNMSVYAEVINLRVSYTPNTNAKFTASYRFVVPTWNQQTVNWYYTAPYTTPEYTVTNQVPPCTGVPPKVNFQYRLTFPDARRPYTIRRKAYARVGVPGRPSIGGPTMPTNYIKLDILNTQNVSLGSVFEFQILNVSGNVNSGDIKNITWRDRERKIWRKTTTSTTGVVSTQTLVGHGNQGTEKFKIRIIYRPGTRVINGCNWTYPPIIAETQVITIQK